MHLKAQELTLEPTALQAPAPQERIPSREFWQRAQDRNRNMAELHNRLGMAEYEANEGFIRWKGDIGYFF